MFFVILLLTIGFCVIHCSSIIIQHYWMHSPQSVKSKQQNYRTIKRNTQFFCCENLITSTCITKRLKADVDRTLKLPIRPGTYYLCGCIQQLFQFCILIILCIVFFAEGDSFNGSGTRFLKSEHF